MAVNHPIRFASTCVPAFFRTGFSESANTAAIGAQQSAVRMIYESIIRTYPFRGHERIYISLLCAMLGGHSQCHSTGHSDADDVSPALHKIENVRIEE